MGRDEADIVGSTGADVDATIDSGAITNATLSLHDAASGEDRLWALGPAPENLEENRFYSWPQFSHALTKLAQLRLASKSVTPTKECETMTRPFLLGQKEQILCVVLAFCGGYCHAQSIRVPYHPPVSPASSATHVAPAPPAAPPGVSISSLSPTSANSGPVTLTVDGLGFSAGCTVNWNGTPIVTTLVNSTQLTATVTNAQVAAADTQKNVPVTVTCGGTTTSPPQMFSISPSNCLFFPTRARCLIWGAGSDAKSEEINNLNNFFNTNSQLSFINQVKTIYNAAAGSTNLSVDLAKLNFLPGMQWTVTTNAQLGSSSPTAVGSGTVPTLSSTSAAQAAQNMLWGGTVLTSMIYPVLAAGGASLTSPGGWGVMLDVIGKGGVDIQNFKSSANINVSTPPTHASAGLEGYFVTNSVNAAPAGSSSIFAGSLFAGFSYGYSYTSHGYARDYGFGNAGHNALGQISVGILMNNVATITISRGFGPKQSYIDNTSGTPVARYVNNFKTWSFGVTYQPAASSNSK
jgi:hypothetical protein